MFEGLSYEEAMEKLDEGTQDLLADHRLRQTVWAARNAMYALRRVTQRMRGTNRGEVLQSLRLMLALAELRDLGYEVKRGDER